MRKKLQTAIVIFMAAIQLTACGGSNCKEKGCDSEIYEDGYCKYHYYKNQAAEAAGAIEDGLRGIINGD